MAAVRTGDENGKPSAQFDQQLVAPSMNGQVKLPEASHKSSWNYSLCLSTIAS